MSLHSTMFESVASAQRPTIGRDAARGVTQDPFTTLFSGVPCSYQEKSSNVVELYAQRNTQINPRVYFGQDPGVAVDDILLIQDMNPGTAKTPIQCLVRGVAQPVGRGWLWWVEVERVVQPVVFTQSSTPL